MRKMRWAGAVAGVAAAGMVLAGCGDSSDEGDVDAVKSALAEETASPSPEDDPFLDGSSGYDSDVMDGSVDSASPTAPAGEMSEGTYEIAARLTGGGGEDREVALPGTYVLKDPLSDCYWERSTGGGDIIENKFVTAATQLTVTVRAGELFTSRNCGTWTLAK